MSSMPNPNTHSSSLLIRCQKQPCYDFEISPALCDLCQGELFAQSPIKNPGKEEYQRIEAE